MKNNPTLRASSNLYKRMVKDSLWYISVFAIILIILQIILNNTKKGEMVSVAAAADNSTRVYLLIVGIIYPLMYFPQYMSAGVTRKQFALGLSFAAALLSCSFAALRIPLELIFREFSPLAILTDAAYGIVYFLTGWTAAISFQFMRLHYIILGAFLANVIFITSQSLRDLPLPLAQHLALALTAGLIISAALAETQKRVPVKC